MEVLDKNVAMLSNFEVYDFLVKSEEEDKKINYKNESQNLATVTYETKEYLSNTPCVIQSADIIKNVLEALSQYSLTKAEKLQLLNVRPQYPVDIQVLVEETEERFEEKEIMDILDIINKLIPSTVKADNNSNDDMNTTTANAMET